MSTILEFKFKLSRGTVIYLTICYTIWKFIKIHCWSNVQVFCLSVCKNSRFIHTRTVSPKMFHSWAIIHKGIKIFSCYTFLSAAHFFFFLHVCLCNCCVGNKSWLYNKLMQKDIIHAETKIFATTLNFAKICSPKFMLLYS